MRAQELAKALLAGPNLHVAISDSRGELWCISEDLTVEPVETRDGKVVVVMTFGKFKPRRVVRGEGKP